MLRRVLSVLLLLAGVGQAATIRVPGDQPTIQAGIDAAAEGNVALVQSRGSCPRPPTIRFTPLRVEALFECPTTSEQNDPAQSRKIVWKPQCFSTVNAVVHR